MSMFCLQSIISVAAGSQRCLALTSFGTVFAWGDNGFDPSHTHTHRIHFVLTICWMTVENIVDGGLKTAFFHHKYKMRLDFGIEARLAYNWFENSCDRCEFALETETQPLFSIKIFLNSTLAHSIAEDDGALLMPLTSKKRTLIWLFTANNDFKMKLTERELKQPKSYFVQSYWNGKRKKQESSWVLSEAHKETVGGSFIFPVDLCWFRSPRFTFLIISFLRNGALGLGDFADRWKHNTSSRFIVFPL